MTRLVPYNPRRIDLPVPDLGFETDVKTNKEAATIAKADEKLEDNSTSNEHEKGRGTKSCSGRKRKYLPRATTSLEDVANANSKANLHALRWYQLYIFKDWDLTRGLVLRAEKAGYKSIVLTVDTPILCDRESDVRNRFSLPNHLTMANSTQIGGVHEHGVHSLRDSGLDEYASELFDLTIIRTT
ncbi:hypothetical protein PsorP6_009919 [Peronosclerospora sorghi]|uniref:Uncharacterized protein n=1 Tax=Peronosclerospora sorghi TaxID=230839 RepID=A0ACC0VTV6_9STRA|nr:hypothetical protein PsorP6_009919 [Peronosclerospora sorghi]